MARNSSTREQAVDVLSEGLGRHKTAWDSKVTARGHRPSWSKTNRITYEATCRRCGGHMAVGPWGSTTSSEIDLRKNDCS